MKFGLASGVLSWTADVAYGAVSHARTFGRENKNSRTCLLFSIHADFPS